jgi:hypothetical protein
VTLGEELGRLQQLHEAGALTDEEFAQAKQALMTGTYGGQRGRDRAAFTSRRKVAAGLFATALLGSAAGGYLLIRGGTPEQSAAVKAARSTEPITKSSATPTRSPSTSPSRSKSPSKASAPRPPAYDPAKLPSGDESASLCLKHNDRKHAASFLNSDTGLKTGVVACRFLRVGHGLDGTPAPAGQHYYWLELAVENLQQDRPLPVPVSDLNRYVVAPANADCGSWYGEERVRGAHSSCLTSGGLQLVTGGPADHNLLLPPGGSELFLLAFGPAPAPATPLQMHYVVASPPAQCTDAPVEEELLACMGDVYQWTLPTPVIPKG